MWPRCKFVVVEIPGLFIFLRPPLLRPKDLQDGSRRGVPRTKKNSLTVNADSAD